MAVRAIALRDFGAIAQRWTTAEPIVVVCFCAAWCDTCTLFQQVFESLASERPAVLFVWFDIEDDDLITGQIDVEDFPTLAVYHGDRLLHFGVSLPHKGTVARLIDELATRSEEVADAPQAVRELPGQFARYVESAL
jgi:thioredoxin reductase (NADPH)